MSRQTWNKGNLYISYGRPSITAHSEEKEVTSLDDVMYFYYDITILQDNKTLFEASSYDYSHVANLPGYIDYLLTYDMEKAYAMERTNQHGFIRNITYHQVILNDGFGLDIEYFYKFERYDYEVKQRNETKYKTWSEYVLTIGKMDVSKEYGGDNREDYGHCIMIKDLTKDDLLRLKKTAEDFCQVAMDVYNKRGY